jgi:hypothetical protein
MESFIEQIPYGVDALAILVALASILSAAIPDTSLPSWLAKIINFVAVNFGAAKNDPGVN